MKLIPTNNMAAYLRKIAIDGYIVQVDHSDIKAMTAEIQKIGVNINQIARRVNSTGSVYQEDIDELKGALTTWATRSISRPASYRSRVRKRSGMTRPNWHLREHPRAYH